MKKSCGSNKSRAAIAKVLTFTKVGEQKWPDNAGHFDLMSLEDHFTIENRVAGANAFPSRAAWKR